MNSAAVYVLIGVAVLVFTVVITARKPAPLEPTRKAARVSYVIDGDTVVLEGADARLRLWGVDAPEKDEKGYLAARNALYRMVQGKRITFIELDRDKYGRIVGRVFLKNGREVNRMMIESGTAREYCRFSKGFYGTC